MRLLVLYQAGDVEKVQPGYYDGFQRLVSEGTLGAHAAMPFYGVSERLGWTAVWAEAARTAQEIGADAIFLQFFHGQIPDPAKGIQSLKNLPNNPTVFTSLGDPFGRWTKLVPRCFRIASALCDVSFLTGMGYLARQLVGWGSRNLVLMPHGCCQVRFTSQVEMCADKLRYDVVFIGSGLHARNPAGHFFWVARKRAELVAAFTERYGNRFGLFGYGWEGNRSWHGAVPFESQHQVYAQARVVLGGTPNAYHDYYMSDRPFIAAASGIPLVDCAVRGVDRILEPSVDWWLAHDIKGMLTLCDRLIEMPESDRLALGLNARERILSKHTQYHRCREMVEIVRQVREARLAGRRAEMPNLSFLAPANSNRKTAPAILAWEG